MTWEALGAAYLFRNLNHRYRRHQPERQTPRFRWLGERFVRQLREYFQQHRPRQACFDDDKGSYSGSAYIFRGLDTATGTITENVKLVASDAAAKRSIWELCQPSGSIGLIGAVRG